jgi:hypothetical protein
LKFISNKEKIQMNDLAGGDGDIESCNASDSVCSNFVFEVENQQGDKSDADKVKKIINKNNKSDVNKKCDPKRKETV